MSESAIFGLVHMNGRIYDPKLGRMLQADPFVQSPKDSQSLNRYTYVNNNPLSYTDPSGYFLSRLWKKWVRPIVAVAVMVVGTYFAPYLVPLWGALSGYIATGTIQGAAIGAFSAWAFGQVGAAFQRTSAAAQTAGAGARAALQAGKVLAHGIVGGVTSYLGGGKFGHGFFSAGFTQAFSAPIGSLDSGSAGFSPARVVAAAVVGGTVSELTGGKFANGAVTGAFSRGFNDELHPFVQKTIQSLQSRKFWTQFVEIPLDQFRVLFPSISNGASDFELELYRSSLYQEFYASELPASALSVARDANDLLKDYTASRVSGIVGARAKIATIIGRGAGLSDYQMELISDSFAIKAFAEQQGLNISQLQDLAKILIQNNQTIDQVVLELQD